MKALILSIFAFATSAFLAADVGAVGVGDPSGGGTIAGSTIIVGIIAPGQGGSGGSYTPDDPAAPAPIRYVWIPMGGAVPQVVPTCSVTGDPTRADGYPWLLIVQDTAGNELSREIVCVPVDPAGPFPPPPPAPPPVPTIGEIWAVAMRDIPPPGLGVNPANKGLTGLDTWLWYEGATQIGVAASIGPWSVTGSAYLAAVTYETGDGASYEAGPGSPGAPAVRHVYETKGGYELTVTGRWEADVVLSGPGLPGTGVPIGSAVLRSTYGYPVVEIRSVLVP